MQEEIKLEIHAMSGEESVFVIGISETLITLVLNITIYGRLYMFVNSLDNVTWYTVFLRL